MEVCQSSAIRLVGRGRHIVPIKRSLCLARKTSGRRVWLDSVNVVEYSNIQPIRDYGVSLDCQDLESHP